MVSIPNLTCFSYPQQVCPETGAAGRRVHVFSLRDFIEITQVFDTAGDFITYLDFRDDLKSIFPCRVHAEAHTLQAIVGNAAELMRIQFPTDPPEVIERTVEVLRRKASGEYMRSSDWKYGLAIDDIIARLHDRDPALPWNQRANARSVQTIAEQFAWLTRDRRIAIGKRLVKMCADARDGNSHHFSHYQASRGVAYVYLATSMPRSKRVEYLKILAAAVHLKYGAKTSVAVATEPVGPGRSYDVGMQQGDLDPETVMKIREFGDLFSHETVLLEL